ncbi:HisA/HisF-related TIM barrel protein [Marinoscillum sp.]|uniref:1-(5-phosphoribosyl)-5-[(5- phosphoribosylamino)methylideneamino]imidazole-4- carboxamide isomerase n=1 Tax=Marinoscillum sp. TaxID=2024838 RepID=UPI003BA8C824
MLLVPSISVIKGRTIRLSQGDYTKEKHYDKSPLDVAEQFADHGISRIHLIDLEGAKKGTPVNYPTLEMIAGHTDLRVNFAGGLHTDGDILKAFEYGAESVAAATIAVYNKELFANWIMSYGREKISLSADALDGMIKVGGWQKDTKIELEDHIEFFYDRGLKYLKTTDISKDGVLEGPAFKLYERLTQRFPELCIFASGGVRHMDDIKKLQDIGVYGVIFGKAFYEGQITLQELAQFHQ